MGSSCSILNDTSHDVWMHHDINWEAFIAVTSGVLTVLQGVSDLLAHHAEEGEGCFRYAKGKMILDRGGRGTGEVADRRIVGLTRNGWTTVGSVLAMTDEALARVLRVPRSEAEKMKSSVEEFHRKAELIKPGEKYAWDGTLSLTMRVYVMSNKLKFDDQPCFTGATAGSERVYKISRHFRNLDVD